MKKYVCASYDKKAKCFSHPFYVGQAEMAIRALHDAANDPTHEVFKHPEDYGLFLLGTFDDETGKFTCKGEPENIAEAINLKKGVISV